MVDDDHGSAVVEFVLVSVLVVFVVLALLQVCFALYVRNTLVAAAAEGARFGAADGGTAQDAALHTRRLIEMTLPASYSADVSAGTEQVAGVPSVVVEVKAPLPVVAWFGWGDGVVARGHAMMELP
ncbi:MAG: TadE/TadG family type IV pilus assembly protein [Actinomycetes bacterium]